MWAAICEKKCEKRCSMFVLKKRWSVFWAALTLCDGSGSVLNYYAGSGSVLGPIQIRNICEYKLNVQQEYMVPLIDSKRHLCVAADTFTFTARGPNFVFVS